MNRDENLMTLEDMREDVFTRYGEGDGGGGGADGVAEGMAEGVAEGVAEGEADGVAEAAAVTKETGNGAAPVNEGQSAIIPTDGQGINPKSSAQAAPDYEAAMQAAQMRDANAALSAENESLKQRLDELEAMVQQNAKLANQNVSEQLTADVPELDIDGLLYANETERQKIVGDYNRRLIELAASKASADMLSKISPLMKQYDDAIADKQMNKALDELAAMDGWADVKENSDRIRALSSRPEFANMPISQRMTLAALLDKGMRASASASAASVPDINTQAEAILANPELMKVLTQKRAADVKAKNDGIPSHSAGGSFGNAAFIKAERPTTIEEARAKYNSY